MKVRGLGQVVDEVDFQDLAGADTKRRAGAAAVVAKGRSRTARQQYLSGCGLEAYLQLFVCVPFLRRLGQLASRDGTLPRRQFQISPAPPAVVAAMPSPPSSSARRRLMGCTTVPHPGP